MNRIIPISVAVIIALVSALIVVKEFNKNSSSAPEPQVVQNQNNAGKKAPTRTAPQSQPVFASNDTVDTAGTAPSEPRFQWQPTEEPAADDYADDYPEDSAYQDSYNEPGMGYQPNMDYYTSLFDQDTMQFSNDNPRWRKLVDKTIDTFAKEGLGRDLTREQTARLREGVTRFVNTNLSLTFNAPGTTPRSPEEIQMLRDQAIQDIDRVVQEELGTDIQTLMKNMDPDMIQDALRQLNGLGEIWNQPIHNQG